MTAKVKNLMNELVKRETLEQGGDDAYNALDDKNTWFARRYIRDKDKISTAYRTCSSSAFILRRNIKRLT